MSINVIEAIRTRRSVKQYRDDPIDPETIQSLLELAVLAPNHRMTEPCRFIVMGPEARRAYGTVKGDRRAVVVEDPKAAEAVRRKTVDTLEALPAMVAFVQRLAKDPEVREEDFATVYMGIQNFLLGAMALAIGTHVKTGAVLEDPRTREALGIADHERLVALVQLGAPAIVPDPKPRQGAVERTRWLP